MRALLADARVRLASVDNPYQWSQVVAWVSSIRPLFVSALREHVDGFDAVTAGPRWVSSPLFSSTDLYGRQQDNFDEAAASDRAYNTKIANDAKSSILSYLDGLLALPDTLLVRKAESDVRAPGRGITNHNYGDAHFGDRIDTRVTGSTVGALGVGRGAQAQGTASAGLSQEEHKALILAAQNALNEDQDALEALDARLYEALGQFLRIARAIQVEQASLVEVQRQMKGTLDEVWGDQAAKGMKPKALPRTLKVIEVLATSPLMDLAVKGLVGG